MKKIMVLTIIGFLCFSMVSVLTPEVMGWASTGSNVPLAPLHGLMTYDALRAIGWGILDSSEVSGHANVEEYTYYYHRVSDCENEFLGWKCGNCGTCEECTQQGTLGGAEDGAQFHILEAQRAYISGNLGDAKEHLGYAIHFIQDAACPPHVFPFQEGTLRAAFNFEAYTAAEYLPKDWSSLVEEAPVWNIKGPEDLHDKVVYLSGLVSGLQCSYVRQHDCSTLCKLLGQCPKIGEPSPVSEWAMSDSDVGFCLEQAASLVKGAAIWAHALAFDTYHSYAEIESGLHSLESSGIAKVESIGLSVEGRQIWAIKISDEPSVDDQDEPDALFVGLHHAREWISAEVPYYLAVNLVQSYDSDSTVKMLIDNSEIWIVPVVNPDGLEYSRTNDRDWRKNRRDNGDGTFGVDLNRNYGYMWGGGGSSGETDSDTYRGPSAFSEPETIAIRDFVQDSNRDFQIVMSYHSYSQLILYPWGYTDDPAPDSSVLSVLAEEMSDLIQGVHGETYTPQQSSDLYIASGDLTDWVYGTLEIPPFTIELRPESWQIIPGFELPESQIPDTCEENWPAALYLIRWVVLSQGGGFMDFENGVDEAAIKSTIPGMKFTTTMGYDWVYGDIRSGKYNVNPYGSKAYECHGNVFAWLGPNQGSGRIDFTGATTMTASMLTSTAYGTYLDAYDSSGNFLATSYAGENIWTGSMSEIKVTASDIAYVIVHDTGNYWLIDDLRVRDLLRETNAFQSQDSTNVFQTLDTLDGEASATYEFTNNQKQILKILLNWKGSAFRIQVIGPDGYIFAEMESGNPPIRIVVPAAEIGTWTIIVTAIDVPFDDYPFALDVAAIPLPSDIEPPVTLMEIGSPMFIDSLGDTYVNSSTALTLSALDNEGGSGVASTHHRTCNSTYDSGWTSSSPPIEFHLVDLTDGEYSIDYYSIDNAGNAESTNTTTLVLDNTGPAITVSNPPAGWALQDGVTIMGSLVDSGSGVFSMSFSIREANGNEIPIEPVSYDPATGEWSFYFDTLSVPDGYYSLCIEADDNLGNIALKTVHYSIRNWAVIELLPSSEKNKAGRAMPVKFALRVAAEVDRNQPFVYNEELRIEIFATDDPDNVLQESCYGDTARDYRISSVLYITNFKTLRKTMRYTVIVCRDTFDVGSFEFETVK